VPSYISGVIQGLSLISVLAVFLLNQYKVRFEWRRHPEQRRAEPLEAETHAGL
jgi:hypothetical protein